MTAIMCYNTISRIPFPFGVEIENMASKKLFLNRDDTIREFNGGATFQQLAELNGCSLHTIHNFFTDTDIDTSYTWQNCLKRYSGYSPEDILNMYEIGMYKNEISEVTGLSEGSVGKALGELGVPTAYNRSEAMKNRLHRLSTEEQSALVSAAHEKVRGMKWTEQNLVNGAKGREKAGRLGSVTESLLYSYFLERNRNPTLQKAIWKYNVDFCFGNVAVEVNGSRRLNETIAHITERAKYLLNSGVSIIYVWANLRHPITQNATDNILSLVDFASTFPAGFSKYWVIRSDGKFISSGGADSDDLTFIHTSKGGFYRECRYSSTANHAIPAAELSLQAIL